jgi:hypothetical protein
MEAETKKKHNIWDLPQPGLGLTPRGLADLDRGVSTPAAAASAGRAERDQHAVSLERLDHRLDVARNLPVEVAGRGGLPVPAHTSWLRVTS